MIEAQTTRPRLKAASLAITAISAIALEGMIARSTIRASDATPKAPIVQKLEPQTAPEAIYGHPQQGPLDTEIYLPLISNLNASPGRAINCFPTGPENEVAASYLFGAFDEKGNFKSIPGDRIEWNQKDFRWDITFPKDIETVEELKQKVSPAEWNVWNEVLCDPSCRGVKIKGRMLNPQTGEITNVETQACDPMIDIIDGYIYLEQLATNTSTSTATNIPTATERPTLTQTSTSTSTSSPTETIMSTATLTDTATRTSTLTNTPTVTSSNTPTYTLTPTQTSTSTETYTNTPTYTLTPTLTRTSTRTFTPTIIPSPTSSATPAASCKVEFAYALQGLPEVATSGSFVEVQFFTQDGASEYTALRGRGRYVPINCNVRGKVNEWFCDGGRAGAPELALVRRLIEGQMDFRESQGVNMGRWAPQSEINKLFSYCPTPTATRSNTPFATFTDIPTATSTATLARTATQTRTRTPIIIRPFETPTRTSTIRTPTRAPYPGPTQVGSCRLIHEGPVRVDNNHLSTSGSHIRLQYFFPESTAPGIPPPEFETFMPSRLAQGGTWNILRRVMGYAWEFAACTDEQMVRDANESYLRRRAGNHPNQGYRSWQATCNFSPEGSSGIPPAGCVTPTPTRITLTNPAHMEFSLGGNSAAL